VKLSNRAQFGVVVAACALAAAGAAYATSKFRHSSSSASGLTPGYVGARARGWDGRPFGFRHHDSLSTAASYLEITEQSLFDQLRAGKTLAEIANATPGKSASGLVDALVKELGEGSRARIEALVNGTFAPPGPGPNRFSPGPPRI
jgi:hypothetical protein